MSQSSMIRLSVLLLAFFIASVAASPEDRLSMALRFKTISYQDREQIDYAEFEALHLYLQETFPLVFGELEVETVSDYSLLLRWPG